MADNYNPKQVRRIIAKFYEAEKINRMKVAKLVTIFEKYGFERSKVSGNSGWMADIRSNYRFYYDAQTEELCRK